MFDTANQTRLSTADRVDKTEYYRTLLESERQGREQADKEIISLLHDVKNRYETKLSNYMAKKQNQKNKDKDSAEKQPKKGQPEKQLKKSKAADKPADDWGTSTEVADMANEGWGSSNQPAEQENDGWGTSNQATDKADDSWDNSNQPADKEGDGWGNTDQPSDNGNDGWGSSDQPAEQATDCWTSSTQPVTNKDDGWGTSTAKATPESTKTQPTKGQAKQAKKNKKNQTESVSKSTAQKNDEAPDDWTSSAQRPTKDEDDGWGTSTQSANKAGDTWDTLPPINPAQQTKGSSKQDQGQKCQSQKNQANQASTCVSTSTQDQDIKEDWIQQINYLQTQLDVSREEATKLKKRNLRLEKDLDHSKLLIRTLREGCSIVEDQARSFETRHDRIMTTKADLERELIAIKEESSRHITTINKLQKSNEQLSKAFIQSVQSHEACKKELDVLQQKYNRKLETYQIENLRLTESNSQLRKLVDYMQK